MDPGWQDAAATVNSLAEVLKTYNWAGAQEICKRLIGQLEAAPVPFPERAARQILNLLRRKRQFSLMVLLADALIRTGQKAPVIKRQHAQALIDQESYEQASQILKAMLEDAGLPDVEKAEASGLLGRIHKQLYINEADPLAPQQQANLRTAIRYYYDVYKTDPKSFLWHGINVVALLARAARDRVVVEGYPSYETIARDIEAVLAQMEDLEYWDRATAIEVAVALGNRRAAYEHALYLVADPQVDAFEIQSLWRQLTEVWGLSLEEEPGSTLLPTLRAAQLQRAGGRVDVAPEPVARQQAAESGKEPRLEIENPERLFGASRYLPLSWYKTGLKRAEAVARIESLDGLTRGTGFLVRAADFFPGRDAKELIVLTVAHVIGLTGDASRRTLEAQSARARFDAREKSYRVKEVIWSSPPGELDATFVTLELPDLDFEHCPTDSQSAAKTGDRVYLVGHRAGRPGVSVEDNILLETDRTRIRYRAPSAPGSSGCPVFDENWHLIALHHAVIETGPQDVKPCMFACEGISVAAIQQATREMGALPEPAPPIERESGPSYRLRVKPRQMDFFDPVMGSIDGSAEGSDVSFAMDSRTARKELKTFAEEHDKDAVFDPGEAGVFLVSMAKWGRDRFRQIFSDTNRNIREAIENLEPGSRLGIDTVYKSFPWEWVFIEKTIPNDPMFVKDPQKCAAMLSGFLGCRFEIEILPAFTLKRRGLREVLSNGAKTVVMAGINATAFEPIANQNREFISGLAARYGPPPVDSEVFTGRDKTIEMLRRAVGRSADAPHVVYFYCHHSAGHVLSQYGFLDAEESKLIMSGSDAETISVHDLQDVGLDEFHPDHSPLIFLNACGTAQGQDFSPSGFIPYFSELLGASAVLGTLAEVPALHAYNFGRDFLEGWLKGTPAGVVLRRLRIESMQKQYNPFPMFYTLHGIGCLGLEKPVTEMTHESLHH